MITIKRLIWDDWNIEHIARHQVTPAEVEATCKSDFILLSGKKGRLVIVGPTRKRRMLAVILTPNQRKGFTIQ